MIELKIGGTKPNYAIAVNYRAKLAKLIRRMTTNIAETVLQYYASHKEQIAFDAKLDAFTPPARKRNAVDDLQTLINYQIRRWQRYFNAISESMATNYVKDIDNNINLQIKNAFKKSPEDLQKQFYVKFSEASNRALLSKQAAIQNNVNLIKSIPQDYHKRINNDVITAMQAGRDEKYLNKQLLQIEDVTVKQAKLIARDQLRKATSLIDREKRKNLGIKKQEWRHSKGDKVPRPEHVKANGRQYDIDKGCPIKNEKGVLEYIQPGEKINCTCYAISIIEFD